MISDFTKQLKIKQLLRGFPVKVGYLEMLFGDDVVKFMEDKGVICQHRIENTNHWVILE